jgi:hypothetical protein
MNDAEQQAALELALRGDKQARGWLLDRLRPYVRFLVRADRFQGRCIAELTAWLRPMASVPGRCTLPPALLVLASPRSRSSRL